MAATDSDSEDQQFPDDARQLQEFVSELTASQGSVRAFIVSMMPGSPDVGDVLQETNLTLWKSRKRYRPGSNFLAWAFTIARLEVFHARARTKRHGHATLSDDLFNILAVEINTTLKQEDHLRALESCMSKLTRSQRELIEARYMPEHSLEMHARITGRKASALRVALLRIRSALRECVENSLSGEFA